MKKVLALFLAVLFVMAPLAVSAESVYGDVDGNGAVNSVDVIKLSRHLAGWTGYESVNETLSDVNGDEKITILDSIVLSRHWAGWSAYVSLPFEGEVMQEEVLDENIFVREDLSNVYNKLNSDEEVVVTYLGGSVTYGFGTNTPEQTSWRALTYNWLTEKFPDANLTQNNVAIGGTGSHLGAFRTQVDVIDKNTDLLFIEYCVNDSYCGTAKAGLATFYYEQIVRQVRENLPECQIIGIFTRDIYGVANKNKNSVEKMHEAVCEKYGISTIFVGRELCRVLGYSDADWYSYVADIVHPADAGYKVYADLIIKYLEKYLADKDVVSEYANEIKDYTMPAGYADTRNATAKLETVQLKSTDVLCSSKGIGVNSSTKHDASNLKGYIYPTSADNEVVFKFTGTAVDLFANAQYIEYSIDGGKTVTQQITARDDGVFPLIDGLKPTEHTLKIKFLGKNGTGDVSSSNMIKAFLVRGIKE